MDTALLLEEELADARPPRIEEEEMDARLEQMLRS